MLTKKIQITLFMHCAHIMLGKYRYSNGLVIVSSYSLNWGILVYLAIFRKHEVYWYALFARPNHACGILVYCWNFQKTWGILVYRTPKMRYIGMESKFGQQTWGILVYLAKFRKSEVFWYETLVYSIGMWGVQASGLMSLIWGPNFRRHSAASFCQD